VQPMSSIKMLYTCQIYHCMKNRKVDEKWIGLKYTIRLSLNILMNYAAKLVLLHGFRKSLL
jgi:hypothetical protein